MNDEKLETIYHITGIDCAGKRFKIITRNYIHAMAINVYRGTKWKVVNGKRKVMCRVYN